MYFQNPKNEWDRQAELIRETSRTNRALFRKWLRPQLPPNPMPSNAQQLQTFAGAQMVVPMIAITIVWVVATLYLSKVWVFDTENLLFKLVLVFGSFIFTWGILWAVFVNVISEFFYYGDRIQNDERELSPSLRWAFSTNPTLVKFICWLLVPGIASAVFSTQIF